jgi:hypothetical protein
MKKVRGQLAWKEEELVRKRVYEVLQFIGQSMEEEASGLRQSLQGTLKSIHGDNEALADFREVSFFS